jgi:TRAP-type C4-dicarboxylate transport system permease small subunit
MEAFIISYERLFRKVVPFLIATPLVIMTIVIFINTFGRKLLVPFPGALELVEALLVICVYFGVALVALDKGHVNVTFATDKLSPKYKCLLDLFGNIIAAFAFGYLALSAWDIGIQATQIMEYRLAVYRFPLWPFKLLFAFGLTLLFIQLIINSIKCAYLFFGRKSYAGQTIEM